MIYCCDFKNGFRIFYIPRINLILRLVKNHRKNLHSRDKFDFGIGKKSYSQTTTALNSID